MGQSVRLCRNQHFEIWKPLRAMGWVMSIRRSALLIVAAFLMSVLLPALYAQDDKKEKKPSGPAGQLVGVWEIYKTKEPGKPYLPSYKGRPFVSQGANACTLIIEYRSDGTFTRTSRIGNKDTVHEGLWTLEGKELRHKRNGAAEEEVMYLRFDGSNQYTSLEVFEDTVDPGLFAQFKRIR
jgi:hypothetical protein